MKYKLINKKIFTTLALATTISAQVIPAYSADEVSTYDASTTSNSTGINTLANPTQQQIADKYESLNIGNDVNMSFDVEPDFTSGTYGELSESSLSYALNVFNYIRYVAGLPSDVELSDENNAKSQATAFVLASYGQGLTHDLENFKNPDGTAYIPDGMSEEDYQLAVEGATSNLSAGKVTLKSALITSWMSDSNNSNIVEVGHRRNILGPTLEKTGFGYAYNDEAKYKYYTSNYVWDSSAFGTTDIESIAWPAINTPVDLFANDDPWSYSAMYSKSPSSGGFSAIDVEDVKVVLEKLNDDKTVDKTWEFESSSKSASSYSSASDGLEYFNIATNNYGGNFSDCLIFRPSEVTYSEGDVFKVTITNLSGSETIDEYEVNFFDVTNVDDSLSGLEDTTESDSDKLELEKDPSVTLKFEELQDEDLVGFSSKEEYYKSLESFTKFKDLENNYMTSWANDSIAFGLAQGYLYSDSEIEFRPSENVSRAMMVQVLSNMVEDMSEFVYEEGTFNDVDFIDSYAGAVAWALEKEITKGISETEFSPNTDVNRQQMAIFFMRFVEALELELPEVNKEVIEFVDMDTAEFTSDESTESINKLQQAGIVQGDGDGTFRPNDTISKAEFATMLKKLVELLVVEEIK